MSITLRRVVLLAIAALLATGAEAGVASAQPGTFLLTGAIRSAAGTRMEGVTVSARAIGKTFTTNVFTDGTGEFYFPRMEPGRYKVWAQAVGFESGIVDLEVRGSIQRQDFVLVPTNDFALQLRGDEWVASLPEGNDHDRKIKEVFRMTCGSGACHSPNMALKDRFDEKGWKNIIELMSRISPLGYEAKEDAVPNPLFEYYKEDLAAYLAGARGPGPSTMKLAVRPRPKGDETLAVITEYDDPEPGTGLPLFNDGSLWSLGSPSKLDIKNHHAVSGTVDVDGNLWYSDLANSYPYRSVVRIDAKTGISTNFKVPRADGSGMAFSPHDVVSDREGNVWFHANGGLTRIDRTGAMEQFTPPRGTTTGQYGNIDGKGRIWWSGSENGRLGMLAFEPKNRAWTFYRNPPPPKELGSDGAYGMAGDTDGNGWVSQYAVDIMLKADAKNPGKVDTVRIPKAKNAAWELFTGDDRRIFEMLGGAEHHGRGVPNQYVIRKPGAGPGPSDSVWGPAWWNDALIRVDIRTSRVTVVPYPWRDGAGYKAVVDPNGMVWVVFTNGDYVGRYDPKTQKWVKYDLPTLATESHDMHVAPALVNGKVRVIVPYYGGGKTAMIEVRTRDELKALKADARSLRGE